MAQCLYQLWDRQNHSMSNCGRNAEFHKGEITLCEAHARYASACGVSGIKRIPAKKKEGIPA